MDEETVLREAIELSARVRSAGRRAGQWIIYFGAAFAVTAGVLLLAHV
jgi:hypothetical protein